MARTKGAKNRRTKEFEARYDELKDRYGCPIERLFVMAQDPNEKSAYRLQADQTLIKHRFPRPVAEEQKQEQTAFTFTWRDPKTKADGQRVN